YNTSLRCYSVSMMPDSREELDNGGKIILPPSALDILTRLNIVYPMLFKITNKQSDRSTHCGVLEFVADEGKMYIPYWMMRNLLVSEGDLVRIESASLPVATYSKFQPFSVDFLDITNHKAVLENALRSFACLTKGDVVAIKYNDKVYELLVMETKPGQAVSIIECDMSVEFAPPIDYKEPQRNIKEEEKEEEDESEIFEEDEDEFKIFGGEGHRIDGKKKKSAATSAVSVPKELKNRGIPNYDYKIGNLKFIRPKKCANRADDTDVAIDKEFEAFSGQGQILKKSAKLPFVR
ncbi:uncharacterized protein TRIADDRAFT_28674, partial [Trichoplax adhaerens]